MAAVGGLALTLASIAGCAQFSTPTAGPACNAPGVTPTSVKIGLVLPFSGPGAPSFALARSGAEARVGLANDNGGVARRRIDLSVHDDRSTPAGNLVVAVFIDTVPFEPRTAALSTFGDAMTRYEPQITDPDQVAALQGYITADLFIRGLQAAGPCPTRAGFVNGLRSVTSYDAGHLLPGPVNLKTNYTELNACYTIVQVDQAGGGYDVVPGGGGPGGRQWCGRHMVGRLSPPPTGGHPIGAARPVASTPGGTEAEGTEPNYR